MLLLIIDIIIFLQVELSEIMTSLDNPESLKEMLKIVNLRKKKLKYRKRKRKEWQEQKKETKLNAEREHRRIDLWLEKMKWEVSRAKRVLKKIINNNYETC